LKIKWFMFGYIYIKLNWSIIEFECKNKKLWFLISNRINSKGMSNYTFEKLNKSESILHV
jgi:hypothetical protein